jgi:hypothetical protein
MINYQQITEQFGAPLNTVPKPNVPFKLKTWHVIGGIIVGYIIYRGIKVIINEDLKRVRPIIKKEE